MFLDILDTDYVGIIIRLVKENFLLPLGITDGHPAGMTAVFLTEAVLGLFTAFAIPALDYITFFAERIVRRNPNINKINYSVEEGQIKRELRTSLIAISVLPIINCPIHYGLEIGMGKIYLNFNYFDNVFLSTCYLIFQVVLFFLVSDFCIYWIHVLLHSNILYRRLHRIHHSFVYISPFTAFAFHPLDAWMQSSPYWFMPYLIPMHKLTHLVLLLAVTIWTTSIHDRITLTNWRILNGAGHHYVHHRDFKHNYGQYFTWCDRLFGTYKDPNETFINDTDEIDKKIF